MEALKVVNNADGSEIYFHFTGDGRVSRVEIYFPEPKELVDFIKLDALSGHIDTASRNETLKSLAREHKERLKGKEK